MNLFCEIAMIKNNQDFLGTAVSQTATDRTRLKTIWCAVLDRLDCVDIKRMLQLLAVSVSSVIVIVFY